MAFRFSPTVLNSNANKGLQYSGLLQWNTVLSAWVVVNPRSRFSVDATSTATVPVVRIPVPEGTFIGLVSTANTVTALNVLRATAAKDVNSNDWLLTITLSGAAINASDRVSFQAMWDENPIR